jgi:hypothetical protein
MKRQRKTADVREGTHISVPAPWFRKALRVSTYNNQQILEVKDDLDEDQVRSWAEEVRSESRRSTPDWADTVLEEVVEIDYEVEARPGEFLLDVLERHQRKMDLKLANR